MRKAAALPISFAVVLILAGAGRDPASPSSSPTASAYRIPRRRNRDVVTGAACSNLCENGWLPTGLNGECGFDVMRDTSYLPNPDFLACATKWPNGTWRRERQQFLRFVEEIQNPQDCRDPRVTWHLIKLTQYGLGTVVNHLVQTLRKAWLRGLPVAVSNSRMRYADEDAACGGGYSCSLRPLSHCRVQDLPLAQVTTFDVPEAPLSLADACQPHGTYNVMDGRCHCSKGYLPVKPGLCKPRSELGGRCKRVMIETGASSDALKTSFHPCYHNSAPGETLNTNADPRRGFSARKNPPPLTLSNQLKYIFPAISAYVLNSTLLRELEPPSRAQEGCIAVHVRHGDACSTYRKGNYLTRTCFPASTYLTQVRRVSELYGARPVFLATDDQSVVEPMREGLKAMGLEMRSLDIDRAKYNTTKLIESRDEMSGRTVAQEVLLDVWAMSGCDMFVGSMAASPFVLAWNVAAGRKGYFPPFVSIETPLGDPMLWWTKHEYLPGGPMHGKDDANCKCDAQECPETLPNRKRCLRMPSDCRCDALLVEAPKATYGSAVRDKVL